MSWLVTGGAGYIGAHVVRALAATGTPVVALDDLSTGRADRLEGVRGATLVVGSVHDGGLLSELLADPAVQGVVHLAARKSVAESVAEPLRYWRENVGGLTGLLEACRAAGVHRLVYSSSAAVYGAPETELVDEDAGCRPLSPYGQTKLAGEWLVAGCASWGLRAISLRYFNVAGAGADHLGDDGVGNLVPLAFAAVDAGRRPAVFGDDWPTPDGTCVRDYVHVGDVADAHVAAVRALATGRPGSTYNVGRGAGASVLDVLRLVGQVTGSPGHEVLPRRAGDPARVVARADRIAADLGFRATRGLEDMITSAWSAWRSRRPRSARAG